MFVIEIEGAAGMSPSGCLSLTLKVLQGDVSVGVFVIEIEGAGGMSPSRCLSLMLKVPQGMSPSG